MNMKLLYVFILELFLVSFDMVLISISSNFQWENEFISI